MEEDKTIAQMHKAEGNRRLVRREWKQATLHYSKVAMSAVPVRMIRIHLCACACACVRACMYVCMQAMSLDRKQPVYMLLRAYAYYGSGNQEKCILEYFLEDLELLVQLLIVMFREI